LEFFELQFQLFDLARQTTYHYLMGNIVPYSFLDITFRCDKLIGHWNGGGAPDLSHLKNR
jgi:hypothetical protein